MAQRLNIKDTIQQWIDKINAALDLQNVDGAFVNNETSWTNTTLVLTGGKIRVGTAIVDVAGDSLVLPTASVNVVGVDTNTGTLVDHVDGSVPSTDFIPLYIATTNGERITGLEDVRTWAYEDSGAAEAEVSTHEAKSDPHPQYATDQDLTDHVNAADPHTGYTLETELADASNASLGSALVGHRGSDVRSELDRRVIYVDTITDLKALPTSELVDGQQVQIKEYRAGSGVGGGTFYWDAASTETDNSGTIFEVSGVATGRWKRKVPERLTPEMFGADGTKQNDPDALAALLSATKRIALLGTYYSDREILTNGHDIDGSVSEVFSSDGARIIFFGGFATPQAYRNTGAKSVLRSVKFMPESWDGVNGYEGIGARLERQITAYDCSWVGFKKYGMDLWEDVATAKVPYYSQFHNCSWDYSGFAGIRLAQGANAIQIYGGTVRWNGAPSYMTAPVDNSTGWDGIFITHTADVDVPAPDNDFATQGIVIDGIDTSYNARYGLNINYCNQSSIRLGYSEDNKQGTDVRIADCVACDVNILQSQQGASVNVPDLGYGTPRSSANYPNRISVNGTDYGSGSISPQGDFIDYQGGTAKLLAFGTVGATYLRPYGTDGSVETFASGNVQVLVRAPAVSGLPAAAEKWLGVIVRDTSVGPNAVYMCVEQSPGSYTWKSL